MTDLPKTYAPEKRALDAEGITTLEDLAMKTRHEVEILHGVGKTGMKRFDQALTAAGLTWRPEISETLMLRQKQVRTKGDPCAIDAEGTR